MVKKLYQYENGNTTVSIYEDGTKIRQFEGIPTIYHPESLDVKITNYCDLGCKFCLKGDTLVKTTSGEKEIKDITENDIVYTINEKSGDLGTNFVEELIVNDYSGKLIFIEIENGNNLYLTPNHKVYTKNRGWQLAENLTLSDELLIF